MKVTTIGIDLAKDVFGLHGVDGEGRVAFEKRLVRSRLLEFLAKLPPCLVGLEACAHYWARKIEQLGHRVKLMSPRFVKPYCKNDKNDAKCLIYLLSVDTPIVTSVMGWGLVELKPGSRLLAGRP